MNYKKKTAKLMLRILAVGNFIAAAACWRMNGIWTERIYFEDNADLIARGYGFTAVCALVSGIIILSAVAFLRGSGKHRA